MAPLVVIRRGAKQVEYRDRRCDGYRRRPSRLVMGVGDGDGDGDCDGDGSGDAERDGSEILRRNALRLQDEDDGGVHDFDENEDAADEYDEEHGKDEREDNTTDAGEEAADGQATTTRARYSTELQAFPGMRAFSCAACGSVVADRDDVVAKSFFGKTGKAFLMNGMFNIRTGSPRNRYLMTGMHSICDVMCACCDAVLGWKYLRAMEQSQRYKEGKFIMEQAVVQDDSEEHERAWQRQ